MHKKHFKNVISSLILLLISTPAFTQLNDVGGIGTFELSKSIGEFTIISAEQEFRFDHHFTSFNRSATSVNADFTILNRVLKAEVAYILLYRKDNSNFYEFRHRVNAGLVGQYRIDRFIFKLRTRGQATFLDGDIQEVSFNPRYVWRNRLAVEYNIRKSPFKPYITGEIFTPINGKKGFFMDAYRLTVGTKYKVSKQSSLDLMLRFDQEVQVSNPQNILYFNLGWSYEI